MVLNKIDLLPYLQYDVQANITYARRVNPLIRIIQVSATSGAGMDEWLGFLRSGLTVARLTRTEAVQAT
jgi:hydrogenase nickel incorporation protein HypB